MTKKRIYRDWPKVFEEWRKSELTMKSFCESRDIHPSVFRYSLKRHQKRSSSEESASRAQNRNKNSIGFSEVKVDDSGLGATFLKITTPSGCILEVPL